MVREAGHDDLHLYCQHLVADKGDCHSFEATEFQVSLGYKGRVCSSLPEEKATEKNKLRWVGGWPGTQLVRADCTHLFLDLCSELLNWVAQNYTMEVSSLFANLSPKNV